MEYTFYMDIFWIVNCYVNVILWIWVKIFLGKTSSAKRIIFAGMFGGSAGTVWLWLLGQYSQRWYSNPAIWLIGVIAYIGTVLGMMRIAFPKEKGKERIYIFFVYHIAAMIFAGFLSFSPGGRVQGIRSVSLFELFWKSLVYLGVLPFVCMLYRRQKIAVTQYYKIELEKEGQIQQGIGLLDTGNSLRNVFTNEPVIVAEYDFIKPILSETEQLQLGNMLEWEVGACEQQGKIVCIPYHSIGKKDGMLFGIYLDHLRIYQGDTVKDNIHTLVGLYTEKLSATGEYQVILHVDCVK